MVMVLVVAIMLLLPSGLFAFDVARVNLAQSQLRAATDAAVLAASQAFSRHPEKGEKAKKAAKETALMFFQRNLVSSGTLKDSKLSESVDTDDPALGKATLDLVFEENDSRIRAKASYGILPAFAGMLGLGKTTIRSNSLAGATGIEGDVVIVVDLSGSMSSATISNLVNRSTDQTGKPSYSKQGQIGSVSNFAEAGSPDSGNVRILPDASKVDFKNSKLMQALANAPESLQLAALYEAKAGNLENESIFKQNGLDKTELHNYIRPGDGFQEEYQRLALGCAQPLASEKQAINDFVDQLRAGKEVHIGLVTYAAGVSTNGDHKDKFSTKSGHKLPSVELSKNESRFEDTIESIAPSPTFSSTNTGGAIEAATAMLTGNKHREAASKTIVLLTDGMPNVGPDPYQAAKKAGEKGIRLYTVGFFHTQYSQVDGPKVLNAMVAQAGNGSKAFNAPDVPTLNDALAEISKGGISLIND